MNATRKPESLPVPKGNAPYCKCGCGHRTSSLHSEYIYSHRQWKTQTADQRFWAKVDKSDGCWNWTASLTANGYALFKLDTTAGKSIMAHRYAYQELNGPIPDDLTIDHLCKNRRCCNPAHMEVVTRGENSRRGKGWIQGVAVRRANAEIGCRKGHPRTPDHAFKTPKGNWRCRTCDRIRQATKKAKGLKE